jgi:hypothetical protein
MNFSAAIFMKLSVLGHLPVPKCVESDEGFIKSRQNFVDFSKQNIPFAAPIVTTPKCAVQLYMEMPRISAKEWVFAKHTLARVL